MKIILLSAYLISSSFFQQDAATKKADSNTSVQQSQGANNPAMRKKGGANMADQSQSTSPSASPAMKKSDAPTGNKTIEAPANPAAAPNPAMRATQPKN